MANVAGTEPLHFQKNGVLVAIDEHLDHAEFVAGGFTFGPERAPRAAKEGGKAGATRRRERLLVHETDHRDFGSFCVLDNCWDKAI